MSIHYERPTKLVKVDYEVRCSNGKPIATFHSEASADSWLNRRQGYGYKLYAITTLEEELI